jgi:hypothetical protein
MIEEPKISPSPWKPWSACAALTKNDDPMWEDKYAYGGAITKNHKTVTMPLHYLAAELAALRPATVKTNALVFADRVPSMKKWQTILTKAGMSYFDPQRPRGTFIPCVTRSARRWP